MSIPIDSIATQIHADASSRDNLELSQLGKYPS